MTQRILRGRDRVSTSAYFVAAAICLAASQQAQAQTAPANTGAAAASSEEEIVELSPFIIEASEDAGYQAKATLAGTQVRTELRDVGSAISVVTPKFLQDTNSKNATDLLVLTTSTEVSGQGGNFLGGGDGAIVDSRANVTSPVGNTRVRGLAAADNVRDFFLTDIPWDSYNVGRVDLQRGANSILFGIGSPAGIINSSINTATFKDANKVEFQVATYGTTRASADFNKVILKNELAVRVAGVRDATKFRQKPAYRDDNRVFAAATYTPKFLAVNGMKTTLRANFEKGNVHSNLPRLTPPMDTITPFFLKGTVTGGDGKTYNNMDKTTYLSSESDPVTNRNDALYNPWVGAAGGRVFDGALSFFQPGASTQSGLASSSVYGNFPATSDTTAQGPSRGYRGILGYGSYLQNIRTFGWTVNPFKNRSLTDSSIFDFYNNLIEGDNAKQWNKFKAYNVDLTQTFFNNKVGINATYDYQRAKWGNTNYVSWDAGAIGVDIMDTLIDGTPNPNRGKAYLLSGGGSAGSNNTERTRKTKRAKIYAELDFKDFLDRDSIVTRILGKHNFTLNGTNYQDETDARSWANWYIGSGYAQSASAAVGQAARDVIQVSYLSNESLLGRTSASGLNLQRLTTIQVPTSGTVRNWDTVTKNWKTYDLPVVNNNALSEDARNYSQRRWYKNEITSQVAVWQGYLFDGNLVPMAGWRKDISRFDDAKFKSSGGLAGDFDKWSDTVRVEGQTRTYSIVGHVPRSIMKHVPGDLGLSAFYNKSENFQPDASRLDIIGNPIAAPSGETKDYGIMITAFDEKVSLKINKYETRVNLQTLSGEIGNAYMLGAGEAWGQQAAVKLKANAGQWPGDGNFGITSTGQILRWEPEGIDANDKLGRQPNRTYDNAQGRWVYTQAAIDATYAEQVASVNDWLAKPVPASMQTAWKMSDYATGGGSWSMNSVSVTGDTLSKGTEFELAANPIKGLDISINAAKTDATRLNIGQAYVDWIEKRFKDYQGPMGDMRIWGGGNWFYDSGRAAVVGKYGTNGSDGTVRNKFYNETYPNYLLMKALTNTSVPELRPWRFNVTANYAFQDGILKGANVGGSYRWQDRQVTGFGLNAAGDGYDVTKRWYGPSDDAVDLWIGYSRKITEKINWRIQLNVRNLLYSKDLIPVTVQPDGTAGAFRIPEPRVFTLTNSFEF